MRYASTEGIDPRVIDLLLEVKDTNTSSQSTSSHTARTIFTGVQGRPKFSIPKEPLQFLIGQRFNIPTIASILYVFQLSKGDCKSSVSAVGKCIAQ